MSTERDFKIEKINAYRKLLNLTLKPLTKDDVVQSEIQIEFINFVEDTLNVLMGNRTPSTLTEDEIIVLKLLVANAQKRASPQPEIPSKVLNKNDGTTIKELNAPTKRLEESKGYVPKNIQPPLGNRKTDGDGKDKRSANQGMLDQLEAMDRKFENEW